MEDAVFVPNSQIRSAILKNALKAYVVQPIIRFYNIIAVRCLWSEEESDKTTWVKRRLIELLLDKEPRVIVHVSCITALVKKNSSKRKHDSSDDEDDTTVPCTSERTRQAGVSFWIACDVPDVGMPSLENDIIKLFLAADLNIQSCRSVHGRGKNKRLLPIFLFR